MSEREYLEDTACVLELSKIIICIMNIWILRDVALMPTYMSRRMVSWRSEVRTRELNIF